MLKNLFVFSFFFFNLVPVHAHSFAYCDRLFVSDYNEALEPEQAQNGDEEHLVGQEKTSSRVRFNRRKAKGYFIIFSAMTGTAAASVYTISHLPKDLQFLSQVIGDVSALVTVGLAAPIWAPLLSKYRKYGFLLLEQDQKPKVKSKYLDDLWQRTQGAYSINEQMSRNVVHAYLLAAQPIFSEARQETLKGQTEIAIGLLADIAVRLRLLFSDVEPDDPNVVRAVRVSFSNHVEDLQGLKAKVYEQISLIDFDFKDEKVRMYYENLLSSWFRL